MGLRDGDEVVVIGLFWCLDIAMRFCFERFQQRIAIVQRYELAQSGVSGVSCSETSFWWKIYGGLS